MITADFAYVRWLGDRKAIEEQTTWDKAIVDRTSDFIGVFELWRRGWDYTQRNLLLGRVGMRFFDTATYCIPRIYFEPSQALVNKAFAATPKSRKYAKW